ncbi:hypothetical protein QEN19_001776 [Hanseniaspora menglaensis]
MLSSKNDKSNDKNNKLLNNKIVDQNNINFLLSGDQPSYSKLKLTGEFSASIKYISPIKKLKQLRKNTNSNLSPSIYFSKSSNSGENWDFNNYSTPNQSEKSTPRKHKDFNDSDFFNYNDTPPSTSILSEYSQRTTSISISKLSHQFPLKLSTEELKNNCGNINIHNNGMNSSPNNYKKDITTMLMASRQTSMDLNNYVSGTTIDSFESDNNSFSNTENFSGNQKSSKKYKTKKKNIKRLTTSLCCLCKDNVAKKSADENILTLKCGHCAHDSCIHLFMIDEKDKEFHYGFMAFPFCGECNDSETRCISVDESHNDALMTKYLLNNDTDDLNYLPKNTSYFLQAKNLRYSSSQEYITEDINFLDGLPVPDFDSNPQLKQKIELTQNLEPIPHSKKSKKSEDNILLKKIEKEMSKVSTVLNNDKNLDLKINDKLGYLKQMNNLTQPLDNDIDSFLTIETRHSEILKSKSVKNASYPRNSILSKHSTHKRLLAANSPKPIVKRLQPNLPSTFILSSVQSSVENPYEIVDTDENKELIIVQIESPSNLKEMQRHGSLINQSNNLNFSITSDNLIKLVSHRLQTVQELVERHPLELSKKKIDSNLGLLRIVDDFKVLLVLSQTQNYRNCKCFLFEKMLLLEFENNDLKKIMITPQSINVEAIDSQTFRVSCLCSDDINILHFNSPTDCSKKLEKWISALLNFDLEFQDDPFLPIIEQNLQNLENENTISELKDTIVKRGDFQISNLLPIQNILSPVNLVVVLQLDSTKLIKKSENFNLINSIKALEIYCKKKNGILKFVVLDENLKILTIGASKDILNQLNGNLHFDQIRGKYFNENQWSSSVLQAYYSLVKDPVAVIVLSNTEMIESGNCLFSDFYGSQNNVLKIHIGYLNVDYSDCITDLVEINTWIELMEIICVSFDIEFDNDDIENYECIKQIKIKPEPMTIYVELM